MNCKRSAVGAVALGNHLYVCGGFDGISSLDTVERWACCALCGFSLNAFSHRFDPEENLWTMMPSMTKVSFWTLPAAYLHLLSAPVCSRSGATSWEDVRTGRPQRALHLRQRRGVRHSDGVLGGDCSHALQALQTWGKLESFATKQLRPVTAPTLCNSSNKQLTTSTRWQHWVGRSTRVEATTARHSSDLWSALTPLPASE